MKRGILLILILLISFALVAGLSFSDLGEEDFSGTFNNTFYNLSGFVQVGNLSINGSEITEMIGNENGLIAYWRLNESSWNGTSGEVKDVLGNRNGTSISGANTTSGLFARAGSFDGVNDYVNLGNIFSSPQDNGTISFWFKTSDTNGTILSQDATGWNNLDTLFGIGQQNVIACTAGYLCFETHGPSTSLSRGVNSGVIVNDNEWHFAVLSFNNTGYYLYLDGDLKNTVAYDGGIWGSNGSQDIYMGQRQLMSYYSGNVDEVAFWNRDLNSTEIQELYQKGSNSSGEQPTTGTYESEVKDAGGISNWTDISWNGLSSGNPLGKANIIFLRMNGNAYDENGINNGTVSGAVNASGKYDSAYYFDGVNDYIIVADSSSLDLTSDFSLGAWVNMSSLPSGVNEWRGIITKGGQGDGLGTDHNYFLAIDNAIWGTGVGITFGYENSAGANFDTRYQINSTYLNAWHHIVGVFNDSVNTMTLYINGIQVSQDSDVTATPTTQSEPLFIGRNMNGSSNIYYFNGTIDDAFITNKSLSLTQIQEIYSNNDYSSSSEGGSSNLQIQVRTSNDNSSWTDYTSYYNYPSSLNISNSRYIQYRAYFADVLAKLYNLTINYLSLGAVSVSLDSPADNYLTNEYNINVTCSASASAGLVNITPYYSKFDWGQSEPARSVSGTSNTTIFTLNEISSTINWNCYACDVEGNCSFASQNRTIIGDILSPEITLISPANNNLSTERSNNFVFNVTDNRAGTLNCTLYVDSEAKASNSSVFSGVSTILSASLSNGNYSWWINCSDGINYNISETRNISVNNTGNIIWAKTQIHTHTTNSDGSSSPATVISTYKNADYNILAVTDHNVITNCSNYTNLSENFICIQSEEWTPGSGTYLKHVLRINISSHVAVGTSTDAEVQNAMTTAKNEGGFAVAAHPNWSSTLWNTSSLINFQNYSHMEIYNGVIERLSPSPYAVQKWDVVLQSGKRMFGVASDDMHVISSDFGKGWIMVYMEDFTKEEFLSSMNNGHLYSTQGPTMNSEFTLYCDDGESYYMGEIANCTEILVNATISATNSSYKLQNISLIKDGVSLSVKNDCPASQNCTFNYSENVSSSGYYRLEAWDSNNKQIWSNPIWITKFVPKINITINVPLNGSTTTEHFPEFNVTLDRVAEALWFNHKGANQTLCVNCSSYYGNGGNLQEGVHNFRVYANNSNNEVSTALSTFTIDFNKTYYENFSNNFSISSITNAFWNSNKISLATNETSGNITIKNMVAVNNLSSLRIIWTENNTENARGEGQLNPVRFFYKFRDDSWSELINGSEISGLNTNNLSMKFEFDKNNYTSIDLLNFRLTWTEFTIPLISNVSESTTTSSATISWATDTASNSSVEYGTSFSLGSIQSNSSDTTSHLVTLTGLSPNTVYYYKIKSCTIDSCSDYPQYPYPLDSFTTQQIPGGNNGGGGGGGSGGGNTTTTIINTTNITGVHAMSSSTIDNIVAKDGDIKSISWKVKNTGTLFLNNCVLKAVGDKFSWLSVGEIFNLAAGQEHDFVFKINVPKGTSSGVYSMGVELVCKELSERADFNVEITKSKLNFDLIKVERAGGNEIIIKYNLKEISGINQEVNLQFMIFDDKNNKILEAIDIRELKAFEEGEFTLRIKVDKRLKGNLNLLVNLNSETYSGFIQEDVFLAPMSGFSIFGETLEGSDIVLWGAIAFVSGIILFFIAKQIINSRKAKRRMNNIIYLGYHR
ncbi:MAG TPA: LamG-like jellyroll fold domain-containing protein [Candidatus Nanoarchaeia archaeon]|nr:LamG-like jellyroll fold domain-containing protein [Candidatus Nanoarchaeia archaeon]